MLHLIAFSKIGDKTFACDYMKLADNKNYADNLLEEAF